MTKQPGRKKPKRGLIREMRLSPDLDFLSEVLDENRLEQNADGWFTIPWRDGLNATRLASTLIQPDDLFDADTYAATKFVRKSIEQVSMLMVMPTSLHWRCSEIINELNFAKSSPYLYAALRCLQVLSSNSSGGGEAYNVILRRAVEKDVEVNNTPLGFIEPIMLATRCHDALGVWPTINNDSDDRYRRAFTIAWQRGLFHAAYAIRRPNLWQKEIRTP